MPRADVQIVDILDADPGWRALFFPLPGHRNAEPAALAVEAATRQGRYEQTYQTMFETQASGGEQQVSQAPTFRGFAGRLEMWT